MGARKVKLGNGDTLAHYACRIGDVRLLQSCEKSSFFRSNLDGKKPLHEASQHGQCACVRWLLENGADVDALKKADWTPLMLACTKHDFDVVALLVINGANVGLTNKDGWSCFHLSARKGDYFIFDYLLQKLPEGIFCTSNNGRTPLHVAAYNGHMDIVRRILTENSITVSTKDKCGMTAWMEALKVGNTEIAMLLFEFRNNVSHIMDTLDYSFRNILHICCEAGSALSVSFLLHHWPDTVDTVDGLYGMTGLHYAAKEGHCEIIKLLLNASANPMLCDHSGRKPFDCSFVKQSEACQQLFRPLCDPT